MAGDGVISHNRGVIITNTEKKKVTGEDQDNQYKKTE